jgi:hypothetical protein
MTISTILREARLSHLHEARQFVSRTLHIDIVHVTREVAVAYIQEHFETGGYSGWDGWVEMLEADEASIRRYQERSK